MGLRGPLSLLSQRSDIWLGDRLAPPVTVGLATGFAGLDAELPGQGWPRGALIELLDEPMGALSLALVLPALRALAGERPIVLVGPPGRPYAPAWARQLPAACLWLVDAAGRDAAWATEWLLKSGAAAVLAWLPQLDAAGVRRLQVACAGSPGLAWVMRPVAYRDHASAAPLRLHLASAPAGLQLQVLKRRGAPCGKVLHLEIPRPRARGSGQNAPAGRQSWGSHALVGA